jgi:Flp pilus assembly pilin Flp
MLIASVIVAAVSSLGANVSALFGAFATAIQNAM